MKKMIVLFGFLMGLVISGCEVLDTPTTTTNPSTSSSDTSATQGEYQLVWADEFDYTGLPDPSKWTYDLGGSGWGNNELEYYTNRADNAYVQDGNLEITLKKESYSGRNYTSARLLSQNEGNWLYGKIDVRAKLPQGKGTWPAIWMLPTDWTYGGWPDSGEIDIMEHVGYDPNTIHGTLHTGNRHSDNPIGKPYTLDDVFDTYHDYSIEWSPNQIKFFVDDYNYFTVNNNAYLNPDNSYMNWPFDQTFHLILNIAFGGNWGGSQGIDANFTESKMFVDYVRVFQMDYAAFDQTAPSDVSNVVVVNSTPLDTLVRFTDATDNTGIDHYDYYVDNVLKGSTSVSLFHLTNLEANTDYDVKIIAVDFAGNKSLGLTYVVTTGNFTDVTSKIEAEYFTTMTGMQSETCTDIGGGFNLGYINSNDMLTYTLNVSESGTYTVTYRVASQDAGGTLSIYGGTGSTFLAQTTFAKTNGWQNWTSVTSDSFNLHQGVNTIKIVANSDGFNLNYFQMTKIN